MIEELYMKYVDDPSLLTNVSKNEDPFWDPVEDIYIGWWVWLISLV